MTANIKRSKTTLPPEATELAERLRAWRATRVSGQRIPSEIWKSAGELARASGISAISSALGLHYYDLKRHAFPEKNSASPKPPAFVELARPVVPPSPESWTLELHQPSGSKLTLRLPHATAKELLPLVQSFLRS